MFGALGPQQEYFRYAIQIHVHMHIFCTVALKLNISLMIPWTCCLDYEPVVNQKSLWNEPFIYMMAEFQVVPRGCC